MKGLLLLVRRSIRHGARAFSSGVSCRVWLVRIATLWVIAIGTPTTFAQLISVGPLTRTDSLCGADPQCNCCVDATGTVQATLRAKSVASDDGDGGDCTATVMLKGPIKIGPKPTRVIIQGTLTGEFTVGDINDVDDGAFVVATTFVDGIGFTTFQVDGLMSEGTKPVNDTDSERICLAPGDHEVTIELLATARLDSDLGISDFNTSDFKSGGFVVEFIDDGVVEVTSYCTAKSGLTCGLPFISSLGIPCACETTGFEVRAAPARGKRSGLLLYGCNGAAAIPFQGGYLCINPIPLLRTESVSSGGTAGQCDGIFSLDWNKFASGNGGGNPDACLKVPGQSVHVQWWGRDAVATGSYLTNALSFTM